MFWIFFLWQIFYFFNFKVIVLWLMVANTLAFKLNLYYKHHIGCFARILEFSLVFFQNYIGRMCISNDVLNVLQLRTWILLNITNKRWVLFDYLLKLLDIRLAPKISFTEYRFHMFLLINLWSVPWQNAPVSRLSNVVAVNVIWFLCI